MLLFLLFFTNVFRVFVFSYADPYGGGVAGYHPSAVGGGYGPAVSPTSAGHFAMPPCPPSAALPGTGTVVGRGSVIQAATANCYQPNGAGAANLNDLYYMDFGAPTATAAMYHQKVVGNKSGSGKKPKKYGGVGRPSAAGSPGAVQQQACPATGPKRKSREGKLFICNFTDVLQYACLL